MKLKERKPKNRRLVREMVGGEPYEYVPLGKHVVSAPGVCRGRPTFKYTRIEVAGVLNRLAAGHPIETLTSAYRGRVSHAAIEEAVALASKALVREVRPSRVLVRQLRRPAGAA